LINKKLQISKIVSIKLIEDRIDFNLHKSFIVPLQKYHLAIKKCDLHYPLFHPIIDIFYLVIDYPIIGMIGQSNHW
jgi:hypothetical protein